MLSVMLRGPVPQFMPMTSMGNGSSAVSAAPISVPLSIVPEDFNRHLRDDGHAPLRAA